ncbi:MAG: glycosyltransferase family 4 protein [Bacteroidia bacterium]|nr:glycosyltransferase family 4 protein [Bacteroidia bacterium]
MTDKEKLKVVFCTDGIFPNAVGGMQKHSRLLIEELAKDPGIELTVIHPHPNERIFDENLNITEIGLNGELHKNYIRNCYLYSKQVFEQLKKIDNAIIYSQGLSVWYGIDELAERLIINPHGLEPYQTLSVKDYLKTAHFRVIFNKLFNKAAKTISLGGKLTGILEDRIKSSKQKLAIIPNAVNPPPSKKAKTNWREPLHFMFVGRFAFNKGIEDLLQCAADLNYSGYEERVKFSLVGKGPLYEKLKARYVAPNIYFAGFASDDELNRIYQDAHMFVLPTLFEGMPTVVLEAMGHGLPIAVTDVGATKEQVDSSNGYIIRKHDPSSIKNAIVDFIEKTDAEKTAMSQASIDRVHSKFTWTQVAAKHKELFRSINA